MKIKKNKFGIFIKSLVAVFLLTAVLVSTLFGTVTAEFVKAFSKSLDFEELSVIAYEYYIKDGNHTSGTTNAAYIEQSNIEQPIVINSTVNGNAAIYEIKLPVTEKGLYRLDFTVDFILNSDAKAEYFVPISNANGGDSLNSPVGCRMNDSATFTKAPTYLIKYDDTKVPYNDKSVYGPNVKYTATTSNGKTVYTLDPENGTKDAYQTYQWKTLAPSRKENVSLTFDYQNGGSGVIWSWDFRGLNAGNYVLKLEGIKLVKVNAPENEPYVDFANTHYVNNALCPDHTSDSVNLGSKNDKHNTLRVHVIDWPVESSLPIIGKKESGKTRTSPARGTYITEASYNSMTMQAESLVFGYHDENIVDPNYAKAQDWSDYDETLNRFSNLISFGMPIKNITAGKTYKVTFDVGFARQGAVADEVNSRGMDIENYPDSSIPNGYADYSDFYDIFMSRNDTIGGSLHIESYLYSGIKNMNITATDRADAEIIKVQTDYGMAHTYCLSGVTSPIFGAGQVAGTGNALNGNYLTHYNDLWDIKMGNIGNADYGTVTSVNDYRNKSNEVLNSSDTGYNMYNAVRHTEINGENEINWITFTNSTFTFTVPADYDEADGDTLRWTWAIDSFVPKCWYRINFDDVRIEEVVQYGSNVDDNSLVIGGNTAHFEGREVEGLYRGANGTGQNGQPRPHSDVPLANMNTYGPIYDASGISINSTNQTISFTGYAVCKGGVDRYVWSPDNGNTWYDVPTQILTDITDAERLAFAESHAENSTIGLKGLNTNDSNGNESNYSGAVCERVRFTTADGKNANYSLKLDFAGTAYEYMTGLDIIFAAVPLANPNARCEILKITNYNPMKNYRTAILEVESDIMVGSGNPLSAKNSPDSTSEKNESFTNMRGIAYAGTSKYMNATGYALVTADTHDYALLRALVYDIPVEKLLTVKGWALVQGGVDAYYWSVDYGKTWTLCTGTPTNTGAQDLALQRERWYDGVNEVSDNLWHNAYFENGLTIDLSAYEGEVVDVIVAAKARNSNVYCPVGRIDNVAVYGEYGTFYSRIDALGSKTTSSNGNTYVSAIAGGVHYDRREKWNNISDITAANVYSFYEPYNVNNMNMRYFDNGYVEIKMGNSLTITGITAFKTIPNATYSIKGFIKLSANRGTKELSCGTPTIVTAVPDEAKKFSSEFDRVFDFSTDGITVTIPQGMTSNNVYGMMSVYIEMTGTVNGKTVTKKIPIVNTQLKFKT